MGWTIKVSIPCRGKRVISSPECPDGLWGTPSLLFNEYWRFTELHVL
jgi:hypothetical protein